VQARDVVALASTVRGGPLGSLDESVHHGVVVALDADGSVAFAAGNPEAIIFPRSSMKPLQATAMVREGLRLVPRLLALVCASHDGRPEHLAAVREILAGAGLGESSLANTPDHPLDDEEARRAVAAGVPRSSLQMNCSGKHAGMLATCALRGWATDASYLNPDHALQRAITGMLPELTGAAAAHVAVDGCGAPAHALPLVALARGVRAVATARDGARREVADAMRAHPEMVGGPTRDVTLLMRGLPGAVAKDGAEGVFVAALADGRTVALKVADGANRARPPLMRAALTALGVDLSGVDPRAWASPVMGHGRPVGEVRVVASLGAASR
jgi:L-asparaginase II